MYYGLQTQRRDICERLHNDERNTGTIRVQMSVASKSNDNED